ncbi:MAG TPA: tetratricopeptide repeat-containing sensor histidine kinase [Ignavibacteria bacterium]|nr:tetratricopeptide repeat-containing sensor histidine kinase [Ignavibacteria bacterium]
MRISSVNLSEIRLKNGYSLKSIDEMKAKLEAHISSLNFHTVNPSLLKFAEQSLKVFKSYNDYKAVIRAMRLIVAYYYFTSNFKESINQIEKALVYCKKHDLDTDHFLFIAASNYLYLGDMTKALSYIRESLKIRKQKNNKKGIAQCYNSMGLFYNNMGNYFLASRYYLKSLKISRTLPDSADLKNVLNNLAVMYMNVKKYDRAIKILEENISHLGKDSTDLSKLATCYCNLGNVYTHLHDYKTALKYLELGDSISIKINNNINRVQSLNHLGVLHEHKKDYENAEKYFKISLEISNKIGYQNGFLTNYSNLASMYIKTCRFDKAIAMLNKNLVIAKKMKALNILKESYQMLSQVYKINKDHKNAYKFLEKYNKIIEQLNKKKVSLRTKSLLLENEVEMQETELKISDEKNKKLIELSENLDRANKDKNDFIGIVSHDLRNPISTISAIADFINEHSDSLSKEEIQSLIEDIKNCSVKSLDIMSNLLDINSIESGNWNERQEKINLVELISQIKEKNQVFANPKNIEIILNKKIKNPEVITVKMCIEHIINNLVSNAIKYSPFNKKVYITLRDNVKNIYVGIKDEGPGFTESDKKGLFKKFAKLSNKPTGGEPSSGLGLYIIKKLSEIINSQVILESEPGKGATFTLKIPTKR